MNQKKNKLLPCIPAILTDNGEIMYLLDSSLNLVFCNQDGLISLNSDMILNSYNNKILPASDNRNKFNITSFKNDCVKKEITLEIIDNMLEEPNNNNIDKFLPYYNYTKINDDILTKYNLTDISLNKFEASRLFRETYLKDSSEYNKLDNKEKKRFACGLYYYFITEIVNFPESLFTYLEEEKIKLGLQYNEKDSINQFYLNNNRHIEKLIDLQTIFTYKKEEQKGLHGGYIALIVIIVLVVLLGSGYYVWQNRKSAIINTAHPPVEFGHA
jgi:hypothetical protein